MVHGLAPAQTQPGAAATQPGPATTQPRASAVAILMAQNVPGITADMSLDQLIQRASRDLADRNIPVARNIFMAVLQQDPTHIGALFGMGSSYESQGQEARKSADPGIFQRANDLFEAAAKWYRTAALRLFNIGAFADAERAFQRVLATKARDPEAQLGLARTYAALNRDLSAVDLYRDYIENPSAAPDTLAVANLELAQVRRRSRTPNLALSALEAAVKRDRENPEIYAEMARTYSDMSQLPKALAAIDTALSKAPGNPEYMNLKARILLGQRDVNGARQWAGQAIAAAREAWRQHRENPNLLRMLGVYYNTYQQVLEVLLSLPVDSQNAAALTLARVDLARAIQEHAAIDHELALYQALEVLRRVPPSEARNPRLLETVVEVLARLNRIPDAQAVARQLLQIDPANALARRLVEVATQPAG
jgi:tetratricopeptide (TPR) repeat protein